MRNDNWMKGEFFFKALINLDDPDMIYMDQGRTRPKGWVLSKEFFASEKEAKEVYPRCKWPVESLEDVVFAPDPEELVEVKR